MEEEKKNYLTTTNVKRTLIKFAQKKGIKASTLGFKLLNYDTAIKAEFDEEFKDLTRERAAKYEFRKDLIFRDGIEYKQTCYIVPILKKKNGFFDLVCEVDKHDYNCRPTLIIKKNSIFNTKQFNKKEMYKALYLELIKIKAFNNILIDVFNKPTIEGLKRFIKDLYSKNFTEDVEILLFDGVDPEESTKADVIEHYKLKKEDDKKLIEVSETELLVEYIKPVFGKNGFSASGKIIDSELYGTQAKPNFRPDDESILVEDTEDYTKYYSKLKGFIEEKRNILSVEKLYQVGEINRHETTVTDGEVNDIEIVISEKDMTKDGVGDGVELVSQKVKITGAVGKNAVIKAKIANIEGMTHSDSKVFGKEVNVNRHLGTVRASDVHVKSLEGGVIHATHAKVDNIISGTITAETIEIGILKNNAKIFASKHIEINKIDGEDNLLAIDVKKVETLQKKVSFIQKDIDEIKEEIKILAKNPKQKDKVNELLKEIKGKQEAIDNELFNPFDAYISIKEPVNGINKVYFNTQRKDLIIECRTLEGVTYEKLYLEDDDVLETITLHPSGESVEYGS